MKDKYLKEIKGGEPVFKLLDARGPGREVDTMDWELDGYITHCLFPIANCIKQMSDKYYEEDSEPNKYAEILDRLYDAAFLQLMKMEEAIRKDIGMVKIETTNESCRGGFLQQDFLEAYVEKKQKEA